MNKLIAFFRLFTYGRQIANAEQWRKGGVQGTLVTAFVMALVNALAAFGIDVVVDVSLVNQIGVHVIAIGNILIGYIANRNVGVITDASPLDIKPEAPKTPHLNRRDDLYR